MRPTPNHSERVCGRPGLGIRSNRSGDVRIRSSRSRCASRRSQRVRASTLWPMQRSSRWAGCFPGVREPVSDGPSRGTQPPAPIEPSVARRARRSARGARALRRSAPVGSTRWPCACDLAGKPTQVRTPDTVGPSSAVGRVGGVPQSVPPLNPPQMSCRVPVPREFAQPVSHHAIPS